jgi:hypothetical protein
LFIVCSFISNKGTDIKEGHLKELGGLALRLMEMRNPSASSSIPTDSLLFNNKNFSKKEKRFVESEMYLKCISYIKIKYMILQSKLDAASMCDEA